MASFTASIRLPGSARPVQRHVLDVDGFEQRTVTDDHEACLELLRTDHLAKLWSDARGLTGGERNHRALYRSSRRSST